MISCSILGVTIRDSVRLPGMRKSGLTKEDKTELYPRLSHGHRT